MSLPVRIAKNRTNAIKEASISLFLTGPITKPEKYKKLAEGSGLFQLFKLTTETNLNVTFSLGKPSTQETEKKNAGFKVERFENGELSLALQGVNRLDKNYFSLHNLKYVRWEPFLNNFKEVVDNLLKIQGEISITGFALHYTDEFFWDAEGDIDLTQIVQKNEYIPHNFTNIKRGGSLVNLRDNQYEDNSIIDRLQVDVNSAIGRIIRISHNQQIISKEILEMNSDSDYVFKTLGELHARNKEFLKQFLKPDVQKLIGLI